MTTNETRDYPKLARLVRLRRAALGLTIHGLAGKAGMADGPFVEVERGEDAGDHTYIALDKGLDWPLGTCVSLLEHVDAAINEETGAPAKPLTEEDISQALLVGLVTNADLPAEQIRAIKDAVIGDLQRRGLL